MTREINVWDHWPTDAELAALVVDPNTLLDQWDHQYQPLIHPRGSRLTAICTCCDRDFMEGGYLGYAPQGRELFRLLVCPDHAMVRGMMDMEEEEVAALD